MQESPADGPVEIGLVGEADGWHDLSWCDVVWSPREFFHLALSVLPRAVVFDRAALQALEPTRCAAMLTERGSATLVFAVADGVSAEAVARWAVVPDIQWLPRRAVATEVGRRLGRVPPLGRPRIEDWLSDEGSLAPTQERLTLLRPLETIRPFRVRAWAGTTGASSPREFGRTVVGLCGAKPKDLLRDYLVFSDRALRRRGLQRPQYVHLFDYSSVYSLLRALGER